MAVLNATPDSFSDGGRWLDAEAAVARGWELIAQGADIVDVGGESTRPGAQRPSVTEELDRVLPVVQELSSGGAVVSIDTMRAEVARACIEAGALIVNDVSGALADPDMAPMVSEREVVFIAMHWRGHSDQMQQLTGYTDVVADVCRELEESVARLRAAGVPDERLVVDPGFGFAKTAEQSWELLARMGEFDVDDLPVLWGTSRKSFLGQVGRTPAERVAGVPVPPAERDAATAATSVLAAQHEAWGVRVHDVRATSAALDVAARTTAGGALHE